MKFIIHPIDSKERLQEIMPEETKSIVKWKEREKLRIQNVMDNVQYDRQRKPDFALKFYMESLR